MKGKLARTAKGSPTRSNSNNRRQWRIKGVAVGAAVSKTHALFTTHADAGYRNPGLASVCKTERFNWYDRSTRWR